MTVVTGYALSLSISEEPLGREELDGHGEASAAGYKTLILCAFASPLIALIASRTTITAAPFQ